MKHETHKCWAIVWATLFVVLVAPVAAQEYERVGDWYYVPWIDPITDANMSSTFTLDADSTWTLSVMCLSNGGSSVFVTPGNNDPLDGTLSPLMTWRIDRGEPIVENWDLLRDLGLRIRNDRAASFIAALTLARERVVLRFSHPTETYTAIFSVDGAAEAVGLLDGCR